MEKKNIWSEAQVTNYINSIQVNVPLDASYIYGVYELANELIGYVDEENIFRVKYVGRSDNDVAARLRKHVGEKYKRFKYSYASSPKTAFEKECRNYHEFGESQLLDNDIHPDRPKGASWKCPCCNIYD